MEVDSAEDFSSASGDENENMDNLGPLDVDIEETVRRKKARGMFVSGWEEDDEGILEKDMTDVAEQMLTAAENGNVDLMKGLLLRDPLLVQARDVDGYTPLHRAAYNNHVDTVRFLLLAGADPEARTNDGWTPLHSASNWACYETVAVLISNGVNVNCCTNGNLTPLHLAISAQEDAEKVFHTVRYLLEAPGIDASVQSGAGDTPMMLARRLSPRVAEIVSDHLRRR